MFTPIALAPVGLTDNLQALADCSCGCQCTGAGAGGGGGAGAE